ncbi:ankyrin repeat domain-containing protein [Nocardia sp. NPDC006630]|uniref:ankyrin repeat domain-containing protein n=1 Tax=Nocardia sp. NPDC006630 TaxID=3157181 RepID=UPI0033A4CD09
MSTDDEDKVLELAGQIFELARAGDAEKLGAYIDAGVPVNLTNARGDNLLMLAAYYGHEAAVVTLLAHGADPNITNAAGQTPLSGAVFKGEPGILRALVAAGADPDAGDPSARETAAMFEQTELLAQFIKP